MKFTENSTVYEGVSMLVKDKGIFQGYFPYEYSGTKEETLACRETAWLGVYLVNTSRQDLYGPDAINLLNHYCVNRDFSTLKIGGSRHALMCNDKGQLIANGIVTRSGEDYFTTYCLMPPLRIIVDSGEYDVTIVDYDEFFYQIDGPKSLETLELASNDDLHSLKFAQNKTVIIDDAEVFVHRLGMSGSLAYEIHGKPEDAEKVYTAVRRAGEKFGVKPQGIKNYPGWNHTPGGYANQFIHFGYAYDMEDDLYKNYEGFFPRVSLEGSASDNEDNGYVTPYDVGWGNLVNFDHDFVGKKALLELSKSPPRQTVTLEWNVEDVLAVVATQISGMDVEPCEDIMEINERVREFSVLRVDKVMDGGKMLGMTSGRVIDYYHRRFLSLAFIDKDYAKEGTEVTVVWGTPGTPQKEIRATVARFPYYNGEYRNETFDVSVIPRQNS